MKIGSLVEYYNPCSEADIQECLKLGIMKWAPTLHEIYTVRDVGLSRKGDAIVLEEGFMGRDPVSRLEIGMLVECFREVQPPMNVEEELAQIQELELEMV